MFMLLSVLCCFLFLATHAHDQKPRPAANNGRSTTATGASCIPHERDALLAFKHGVTSDPAGLLSSWRRDGGHAEPDCCRWRGVRCSNRTGHVRKLRLRSTGAAMAGEISPSLLALKHLQHLDLSNNELEGSTGRLPEFLGSLKSLRYLNLSSISFRGVVPPQLGNLSKLMYLDLSAASNMKSSDLSWLTRLPSTQYLNLNGVKLSTAVGWSHVINMIPSLRVLGLSGCSLASANQPLPHLNLTKLEELDASSNSFNHSVATSWFWNITSLKYLYLGYTSMYGQLPDALGDMTSLQVLDLSYDDDKNMRIMNIDLTNFCNLEVLMLESAFSQGNLTELFRNLPRCSPNKLQEMHLGNNQLPGTLPRWIGQLTSLIVLDLTGNNITGPIPTNVGRLTGLQTLHLSENHLSGNVPHEIGMLSNLTSLDLGYNELDGVITEKHFASTRILQYIDLSYNALKIELSSDWQPPSLLNTARFAACQMGPLFPRWLQWHAGITSLDISSASIADRLPQWFVNALSNVKLLNISNNQLTGGLPTNMGSMSLLELYLSSNQLTGQIPMLPPNISILDLSVNSLSGPLPSDIGYAQQLESLSLFSNQITSHIPESICNMWLAVLDLSNNFLEGEVPSCLGIMEDMEFMSFSNNSLSGEFPSFVQNFTTVLFLDLSRNKFSGSLPMWIGELPSLRVLRLSHNNFSGKIPVNITNLACLQYVDLSSNGISGSLPSNLSNLKAMRKANLKGECYTGDYAYNLNSLSTVLRGQELNYGSIFRVFYTNMMSIDVSTNKLTGNIPEDVIALDALVSLNLSWNNISGLLPNKIGEMQSLESLDLSRNDISGEIPATMSNMTFLSYMDFSYNNFTGKIPSGAQLDTLYAANPSMYNGNIGLCGHPLPNNCSSKGDASKQRGPGRAEEGLGIESIYLGLGCGFVVATWMAFGVLLFKRSWRIACFQLPDKLYDKVYVLVATWARRTQID
ncbi:hypothetical protein U9M48_020483 [Paspalum notatum var. saurae]|uniref:Leucine-rich repeat-containing N-terminal plant-type domain-containing protein n=1 Tax=Paspalum notatum var. saurae TaxID=547442 RepID=A0AAQ3TF61_PASNO